MNRQSVASHLLDSMKGPRGSRSTARILHVLQKFAEFLAARGIQSVDQVDATILEQYLTSARSVLSPRTVHLEMMTLKSALRMLVPASDLQEKLATLVSASRWNPLGTLTLNTVNSILETADEGEATLVGLLAFAGLRLGELHLHAIVSVDYQTNHVVVEAAKTAKRRLPLHARLRQLLPDPVPAEFQLALVRLRARLRNLPTDSEGGRPSLYSFRHFFAASCLNAGVPRHIVCSWLGINVDSRNPPSDEEAQRWMNLVQF